VDPDVALSWQWVDELIVNGSFETGLNPGWVAGGPNPTMWQLAGSPPDQFARTTIPNVSQALGQIAQDVVIPAEATSATLRWNVRVWNLLPASVIGRLRILVAENGGVVASLEDATGSETVFRAHTWVARSTNLLAYAGRTLQLVVRADTYSTAAVSSWYADVDGFSLSCEHPARPQFLVYVGTNATLSATDQVADTTSLSFDSLALESSKRYYWRVASVRDGVTNSSATRTFTTGRRVLPPLTVAGVNETVARLQFQSRTNRYYFIQQADTVDGMTGWFDVTLSLPGTGGVMEIPVFVPWTAAFWRLRITP
jgi:hypothetical protein